MNAALLKALLNQNGDAREIDIRFRSVWVRDRTNGKGFSLLGVYKFIVRLYLNILDFKNPFAT